MGITAGLCCRGIGRAVAPDLTEASALGHWPASHGLNSNTAYVTLFQGAAQHSPAQPSTAQHSPAQPSAAQPSPAQDRTGQHSTAQHSPAQPSTAQHSTAQHNAQHSTQHNAQHNAQHSTAQRLTGQQQAAPTALAQRTEGSAPAPKCQEPSSA